MIVIAKNINKNYQGLRVLNNFNLTIKAGESVAIVGVSGSGKSTLLNILGGIDMASGGQIISCGENLSIANENQLTKFRAKNLGFVYQFHHLLTDFNALENIQMPLFIQGYNKNQAQQISLATLQQVGLKDRAKHFINQLSGGERQRIAIARAIANKPKLILADEPTGNLDKQNANLVLKLLLNLCKKNNSSLIIVTHDNDIANQTDRKINL